MSRRFAKRARTSYRETFHDTVPLDVNEQYDLIHASEGTTRNVGGKRRAARIEQSPERAAGTWELVSSWSPPDDSNYALPDDGAWYDEAVEAEIMEESPNPAASETVVLPKKKRSVVSQRPHVVWKTFHRDSYLDEIMRWAGRGDFRHAKQCPDCTSRAVDTPGLPEFRCLECALPDLTCQACCVRRHRLQPFHRIQRWTGSRFVNTSLRTLGAKIQLNHSSGYCDSPVACHAKMLVLHTNGIHSVDIQYCGCTREIPQHLQLLRRRLYPASQTTVRTCATFELLRHLHKLALTTKASTYDFYRCLEKSTSNTGLNIPKFRYRALFRMVLQWRHLQMLKWAGRGHAESGAAGTSPGELAVECPSCPHPKKNIPDNWESAPDEMKFLYMMIVCMDANFRLKNQLVSNYSQDPGLGIGWAYMVPREPYENYVRSRADDKDMSTCVGFQALAKANTKFSIGLRYTGVGAVVCGRSEMVLPLSVGNLQKGERYANMDYIFGSILQFVAITMVLISYDIACQWFTNLFKRIADEWPAEIKPPSGLTIIPAIPKLHEPAHNQANHEVYSLNCIHGAGASDCECPERVWSPHNSLGSATKTQGPGSRHDTLDDHFGFWNWSKYISQGTTLLRRYKLAVAERNLQVEGHRGLNDTVEPEQREEWEKMCVAWEADSIPKKAKNPYHVPKSTISEAKVRQKLAESEAKFLAEGGTHPHATTSSMLISIGLELEESKRRIQRLAKNKTATSTIRKAGNLADQRKALLNRIKAWESLLPIYMPGLLQYRADYPIAKAPAYVEDSVLWLPSTIPQDHRKRVCAEKLPEIETELRLAQLNDSLNSLRQILKIKSRMISFKRKNIRGQRDGTRSTTVIDRVHERARFAAAKYRAARVAYLSLMGPGEWETTFRQLDDADIRGYQDPNRIRKRVGRAGTFEDGHVPEEGDQREEEGEFVLFNEERTKRQGTGQTRRTLSWIWLTTKATGSEDDDPDVLRAEWARSRARADRAKEEVMLLKEEMRRVLAYLEWKANLWRSRQDTRPGAKGDLQEALTAYSENQADIQLSLMTHFRELWAKALHEPAVVVPTANTSELPTPVTNAASQRNATSRNEEGDDDDDDEDDDDDDGEEVIEDIEEDEEEVEIAERNTSVT